MEDKIILRIKYKGEDVIVLNNVKTINDARKQAECRVKSWVDSDISKPMKVVTYDKTVHFFNRESLLFASVEQVSPEDQELEDYYSKLTDFHCI